MALQINVNKNYCGKNVEYEASYLKITNKNTSGNLVDATITIYSDSSKMYILDEYHKMFNIDISDNAVNEYKQIYRKLKETVYMDAIDLLDDEQTP